MRFTGRMCRVGVPGCAHDHLDGLSIVLAVAAVAAGLGVARIRQRIGVSASFLVYMLAAAFLGPASAFVSAVVSELPRRA